MKKLLYSLLIGTLAFTFGCEEPDEAQYTVGPGFGSGHSVFTILDNNVTVEFSAANPDVTQMTVVHAGTVNPDGNIITEPKGEIATVEITEGSGTVEFARTDLGIMESSADSVLGHTAMLEVTSNIEGSPTNHVSISPGDPLSSLSTPSAVYHNDDVKKIKFKYHRNGDAVDNIIVERKIGANGTYSALGLSLKTNANDDGVIIDSVEFTGNDYAVGDTVYHKLTATQGSYDISHVTSFVVNKLSYDQTGSFKLDTTTGHAFNLVENMAVMDTMNTALDSADITLYYNANTTNIGFQSPNTSNHAMFVESSMDMWNANNREDTEMAYGEGSPTQQVTNVEAGDVFIYKTYRNYGTDNETEHYGMLKVDEAVITPSGDNYLTLSYMN